MIIVRDEFLIVRKDIAIFKKNYDILSLVREIIVIVIYTYNLYLWLIYGLEMYIP